MSPCSWDHNFIPEFGMFGVWSLRIPVTTDQSFLLIFCTGWIVTAYFAVPPDTQVFQQMAECITVPLPAREAALLSHLRTVIVTAAVYRGFSSSLAALPLTFRHRAGVSPYTSPYGFAETCVFSKQSVGPLNCNLQLLRR